MAGADIDGRRSRPGGGEALDGESGCAISPPPSDLGEAESGSEVSAERE